LRLPSRSHPSHWLSPLWETARFGMEDHAPAGVGRVSDTADGSLVIQNPARTVILPIQARLASLQSLAQTLLLTSILIARLCRSLAARQATAAEPPERRRRCLLARRPWGGGYGL